MDWAAISAIAEIIGVVVVVVSLFFVGLQVRQNTRAILTNSRQGILDADLALIGDYMTHAVDPHLILDDVKLEPADERRFTWMIVKALRIREYAWHQYKAGILDKQSWESYMAPVAGIFSTERARFVLTFYTGDGEFMKQIHAHVDAAKKASETPAPAPAAPTPAAATA